MEDLKDKHPNHGDTMDSMNPFDSNLEEETLDEFNNSDDESFSVLEDTVHQDTCHNCSGSGIDPMDSEEGLPCEVCSGSGTVYIDDFNLDLDVSEYFEEEN